MGKHQNTTYTVGLGNIAPVFAVEGSDPNLLQEINDPASTPRWVPDGPNVVFHVGPI